MGQPGFHAPRPMTLSGCADRFSAPYRTPTFQLMAGDWIKFEHTTPDKPEVIKMANILKIDQDSVVGKLLRVWLWADQNSLTGEGISVTEAFLDRLTCKRGFASAMRTVGWLKGIDGQLAFHNFERHNGVTAKARAESGRRMTRMRALHNSRNKSYANVTEKAQQKPQPEKRREDIYNLAPAKADAGALLLEMPPAKPTEPTEKKPRARNPLVDALVSLDGSDPANATKSAFGAAGTALAEIKQVSPDVTPDEIRRRAANYRRLFKDACISPNALAKHWAATDRVKSNAMAPQAPVHEPQDWKSFLNHEFPESVYSANGVSEAHEWKDLPRDTQFWLINEMKKANAA